MPKAWSKQKELTKEEIPKDIWAVRVAQMIQNPDISAIFSMCYLTGGRISEVLAMKPENISFEDDIMVVDMVNRKNKRRQRKELGIRIDRFRELESIIKPIVNNTHVGTLLFPISKIKVWKELNKIGINPHYIRHVRLTNLARRGMTDRELVMFAGWSNSEPAQFYAHLTYEDYVNKT